LSFPKDRKLSDESFVRMQSMMDPTKQTQLMNYKIDTFANSIWENFIGSQVQVSLT